MTFASRSGRRCAMTDFMPLAKVQPVGKGGASRAADARMLMICSAGAEFDDTLSEEPGP